MSDLSRLRARLLRIERRGKAYAQELNQLQAELETDDAPLRRHTEKAILRLNFQIDSARQEYVLVKRKLAAEERRLLNEPAGFLRFT